MCLWWTTERVAFVSSSITRSTQHTRIGFFPFNSHISHLFLCSRTIRWLCRFSIGIREKTHHSQRTEQKEKCYGWKAATTAANILFHFSVACLATASRPRSIPPFVLVHKQNCTPFTPNARAKTVPFCFLLLSFSAQAESGLCRPAHRTTPNRSHCIRVFIHREPLSVLNFYEIAREQLNSKKKSVVVSLMPLHALCVAIYIPFPVLATCSWWRTMPPRCSSYPWSVYVCCHCPATSAPHFYFFVFSIGALVPTSAQIYRTGCACVCVCELCGPTVVVAYHIDMLRAEHIAGHTMPHSSTAQLLSVYSTYRVIDW